MNKSAIAFFFAIIAVALVAGCAQQAAPQAAASEQQTPQAPAPPAPPAMPESPAQPAQPEVHDHSVTITASGFVPQTLTIEAGEEVTFLNKDSTQHWPASAVHPTHTAYPGSDIAKCGTADAKTVFDACKGLAQGEAFKFTFNQKGSWKYHDHLNPSLWGTVVVE
ncbi:hypothetical protein HYU18_03960 [Candidatus Woesearchaeota archaeon]|nr:hypothetical protein [Candidatus Woesearchaeota archaeon]